ncbi:MAG TPA: hypothetical protein VGD81_11115 [Opitutaceae bacterium]
MKNVLKFIALSFAAGLPGVAFAEILGARFPSAVSAEALIGLFAVAVSLLLAMHEYSSRAAGYEPKPGRRVLSPADEAFVSARSLAYGINARRGAASRGAFHPSVRL